MLPIIQQSIALSAHITCGEFEGLSPSDCGAVFGAVRGRKATKSPARGIAKTSLRSARPFTSTRNSTGLTRIRFLLDTGKNCTSVPKTNRKSIVSMGFPPFRLLRESTIFGSNLVSGIVFLEEHSFGKFFLEN